MSLKKLLKLRIDSNIHICLCFFQILDLSFNRLRILEKTSFTHLPNLKYLYLHENVIQVIEEGTFSHLSGLEAIDLSINGLTTIPTELFSMPLLRNLYIRENNLNGLEAQLEKIAKPIIAPLVKLDVSACSLRRVPNFGILPNLNFLNLSHNSLRELKMQDFSPYCSLVWVDLNHTSVDPCECEITMDNFRMRSTRVILGEGGCNVPHSYKKPYCNQPSNESMIETAEYADCKANVKERELREASVFTWKIISACLGGFFVAFIGLLYLLHRRNVRQIERKLKQKKPPPSMPIVVKTPPIDNDNNTLPMTVMYSKEKEEDAHSDKLINVYDTS